MELISSNCVCVCVSVCVSAHMFWACLSTNFQSWCLICKFCPADNVLHLTGIFFIDRWSHVVQLPSSTFSVNRLNTNNTDRSHSLKEFILYVCAGKRSCTGMDILHSTAAEASNNNNGHFYGTWSFARSRAQCTTQKEAEKCINTYNGQNKKVSGHMTTKPCKNLHTAISVNKPKLSVTKHDQNLIWAHMYNTSRYTANTKMYSRILHTRTHTLALTHSHMGHSPENGTKEGATFPMK